MFKKAKLEGLTLPWTCLTYWPCYTLSFWLIRKDYINTCVPIYDTSISGDWESANLILTERKELIQYIITDNHETAIHIAASTHIIKFIEALLGLMESTESYNINNNEQHESAR